jgi:type VI secretion system protein ImpC
MARNVDPDFPEVHLGTEEAPAAEAVEDEEPFHILLAGDFSGRTEGPRTLKPRRIDRDNFDDVFAAVKISLELRGLALEFRELDDFHPDHIYRSVPIFRDLDAVLDRGAPPQPPAASARAASGLLEEMIAEQSSERPVTLGDATDIDYFLRRVTAGYVERRESPAKQQRAARRDELASTLLRGILHHRRVQSLEAAWRAVHMLVRRLDTDGGLKLYLLDLPLPELLAQADVLAAELRRAGTWRLIAGNYTFDQSADSAEALDRIATLAAGLGAPFLGAGQLSEGAPEDDWNEFRRLDAARWIGLALPRFLLRLPYGKATDAIESFPFEEMPTSDHAAYLWGNPAFACAYLIASGTHRLDGLPLHVYREDGEMVSQPCAEVWLTESEAGELFDQGFMPLASIRDQPAAIVAQFVSIADPPAPLPGIG